jgi:hypothetical protein
MNGETWDERARLIKLPAHGRSRSGPRASDEIMKGTLAEVTRHVAAQDMEELWRFTIITDTERYIRAADLRELIRRDDIPE